MKLYSCYSFFRFFLNLTEIDAINYRLKRMKGQNRFQIISSEGLFQYFENHYKNCVLTLIDYITILIPPVKKVKSNIVLRFLDSSFEDR